MSWPRHCNKYFPLAMRLATRAPGPDFLGPLLKHGFCSLVGDKGPRSNFSRPLTLKLGFCTPVAPLQPPYSTPTAFKIVITDPPRASVGEEFHISFILGDGGVFGFFIWRLPGDMGRLARYDLAPKLAPSAGPVFSVAKKVFPRSPNLAISPTKQITALWSTHTGTKACT